MSDVIHGVRLANGGIGILGFNTTTPGYFTSLCETPASFQLALAAMAEDEELLALGVEVLDGHEAPAEWISLEWLSDESAPSLWSRLLTAATLGTSLPLSAEEVDQVMRTLRFLKETHESLFYGAQQGTCPLVPVAGGPNETSQTLLAQSPRG